MTKEALAERTEREKGKTTEEVLAERRQQELEDKTVLLKNGTREVRQLVPVVMMSLNSLMEQGKGIAVYELVELCRNPEHKPWGNTGVELKSLKLVDETLGEWSVHDSIRNIVLSAAVGEEMDLTLVNPIAEDQSAG